ncbi:hypothetical protein GX50_06606 [[Emmonsia] crescens]|uniref:Uncharacterized protein n=1 Tax=[Emmonsia] crescens TaxID=73230 RepID=A0A2B7ZC83_9EURO|nr:hypothetical protein GX50_06606 [Emmonsia crescens]
MKLSVVSAAFAFAGSVIAAPAPIVPGLPKLPGLGSLPSVQGIPDALTGKLVPSVTKGIGAAGLGSVLGPLKGLLGGGLKGLPLKARQEAGDEISGMTPEQSAEMIQSITEIASALQVDKAVNGKLPEVPGLSKEKQDELLGALKALVSKVAPLTKNGLKDIVPKLDALDVPVQSLTVTVIIIQLSYTFSESMASM